jgi:WD40 repeat protein
MSDVFISYSRKDIAFARLLHKALIDNDLETWIDWQDIPPSTDWLAEVYEAIEASDAFVFIISETSLDSEICGLEVAHAAKHNKRLIPIVIKDVDSDKVPDELAAVNWIFFEDAGDMFDRAMDDLVTAITVDQDWVKAHTRYGMRALDWERKGKDRGLLLRGSDLTEAEAWLAGAAGKEPQPTSLQAGFILESRQDASRRQRLTLFGVGTALVVAIGLGILAWTQRNVAVSEGSARATAQAEALQEADTRATAQAEAISEANARATAQVEAERQRDEADRQTTIALSRAIALKAIEEQEVQPVLALLLAAEAFRIDDNLQTRSSLLTVLQATPQIDRRFLHDHSGWVKSVEFSPDGQYLASSSHNDEILLWDVETQQQVGEMVQLQPISGNWGGVSCVTFSPDGKTLATTGARSIVLWDVTTDGLQNPRELHGPDTGFPPPNYGESLDFSPDGGSLISAGPDNSILLWDVTTGSIRGSLLGGHSLTVESVAFSPRGQLIASASPDDNVKLWDVSSQNLIFELSAENAAAGERGFTGSRSVAFSPDGQILAAGLSDGSIHLWDTESGEEIRPPLSGHQDRVFSLAFSRDGKVLASGSYDSALIIWGVATGEIMFGPLTEHGDGIFSLSFNPDGNLLASGSMDEDVILWELDGGSLPRAHSDSILGLAVNQQGSLLASSSKDGTVHFWDVATQSPQGESIRGVSSSVGSLSFDPTGTALAGYCDGICLWEAPSGHRIGQWEADSVLYPSQLTFSPNGALLASGDGGGNIRLWNPQDGTQLGATIQAFEEEVFALEMPESNSLLAANGFTSQIMAFDLTSGAREYYSLGGNRQVGFIMRFSSTGEFLSTGTADSSWNDILMFDASNGELLFEPLVGHTDLVLALSFSPDGSVLASSSADNTVRLWDLASGQALGMPLTGHRSDVTALTFTPDGSRLFSGDADGVIRVWDAEPALWLSRACDIANHNLSPQEWQTYLPEREYRETCPELG